MLIDRGIAAGRSRIKIRNANTFVSVGLQKAFEEFLLLDAAIEFRELKQVANVEGVANVSRSAGEVAAT